MARAFIGPFDETMTLLYEARDYVRHQEPLDRRAVSPLQAVMISRESMRVTARLTEVMAWLLLRRAVADGEISLENASAPEHRLSRHPVHLDQDGARAMPRRLRNLLERSSTLYGRVARLDEATSAPDSRSAC